jgi:hypothetical protein
MPAISMFYGLIIYMYFQDIDKHNRPHIHVKYQGTETVFLFQTEKFWKEH